MTMATRRALLLSLASLALPSVSMAAALPYIKREDVQAWAGSLSQSSGLPIAWIMNALGHAHHSSRSETIMSSGAKSVTQTPRNWYRHKVRVVTEERIEKGLHFLSAYEKPLSEATQRFGIPAEIITAIIGVETIYGKSKGRHRVIDVLCTLSFDYLRRANYFRTELAAFLIYCHTNNLTPWSIRGSFAGAIGMPQFMPSNILKLALDFDHNGSIDLMDSAYDVIGSVAHYLKAAGWVSDLKPTWSCQCDHAISMELGTGRIRPNTTLQNMLDAGVQFLEEVSAPAETPVFLVDLPIINTEGLSDTLFQAATVNYAAILHYNRSYFYAESVCELARTLKSTSENDDQQLVI